MTPEEEAAWAWYGDLRISEVLICPVCASGVPNMSSVALQHKQWHEQRGEA